MHPLDGAYERVKRAGKHIENLKRRIRIIRKEKTDAVAHDGKVGTVTLPSGREVRAVIRGAGHRPSPAPHIISLLIGESIYNLRASLDYLVYELARLDSPGKTPKGTQFPIESKEEGFKRRRKNFLKGVSLKHIAAIKKLQPFNGCDWTKLLRDVSNPDKHELLTRTGSPLVISPLPGGTERILAGEPMNMKGGISVQITFSNGLPVIENLEELQAQVTETLAAFKPEFE